MTKTISINDLMSKLRSYHEKVSLSLSNDDRVFVLDIVTNDDQFNYLHSKYMFDFVTTSFSWKLFYILFPVPKKTTVYVANFLLDQHSLGSIVDAVNINVVNKIKNDFKNG